MEMLTPYRSETPKILKPKLVGMITSSTATTTPFLWKSVQRGLHRLIPLLLKYNMWLCV